MDRNRFAKLAAFLGMLVFLSGLALFAYAGAYSRFWADDYCYSATVKQLGLFSGLVDWYHTSGNRLSTLAVVAFADLFGWRSIQFTTLAVLAFWAAAWIFFLFQLRRLFQRTVVWYWLVLLALVQVYFAALLAPDRLQTIYWRMGTFHYTLPMPLLLINLGLLAWRYYPPARRFAARRFAAIASLSALLGLFAAGLSETFAAMQAGALLLAIFAALVFFRGPRRGMMGRRAALFLAPALAGTLVMMALMVFAPANAWRQAVMPPPDNPLLVVPYSLRFAGDFIFYTLRGQILPFVVYFIVAGLIALLALPAESVRLSPRGGFFCALISLLVMYLLIVCSFAPSAYAGLAYPAGRALMPGSFALLTGLGGAAFSLALAARPALDRWAGQGRWAVAAAALLMLLSLYPLRAAAVPRQDIERLSVTAARWDDRDAQIRQSIAAGNLDVQVRQVDVVQSLEDMGPDSTQWINACATVFYGARSITAKP